MATASAIYQDASKPVAERVSDLISRMTIEEKVGQLFHNMIVQGPNSTLAGAVPEYDIEDTEVLIGEKMMTHFNLVGEITNAQDTARWYNRLQQRASETRLGIPITLSSDPRSHFSENVGAGFMAGCLSQWPEPLGFAALRDPALVERFADIARQEYLAVGIRCALSPQIDLTTEYRWARTNMTFGEDVNLSISLGAAYIRGFRGKEAQIGKESVSTMAKHFPGGGPEKNGEDPHFEYGKEQVYPGKQFEYHLQPFREAIAAGVGQIMPSYGVPIGTQFEEVAFAFNKGIIQDLLRDQLGFHGIVCTDWGLITDSVILGQNMPARAWGCEKLSEIERVVKLLEAGCDQCGGESRTGLLLQAVQEGFVSEKRLDRSLERLLKEKFELGLFDENRFVNIHAAGQVVGKPEFILEAIEAQRRSCTLLINQGVLPLEQKGQKVYAEGFARASLEARGFIVTETVSDADIALLRLKAPFEPRPGGFEAEFHAGSLDFPAEERARLATIRATVPIMLVDVYLERPAVLKTVATSADALIANYGCHSDSLLDVLLGETVDGVKVGPEGKLPFDLPSSMAAVEKSREDMPWDTESPLFRFGHGLRYPSR